ncbi:MAG: DNA translocase FtsK 4TM domain-containing protein, partial [Planctomycetota bacterium]
MKHGQVYRIALEGFLLCACIFLFFSCLSFDIGDWPSTYVSPNNAPPSNWCGAAGAFCAYHILYYIGPGIFFALISVATALVIHISGKPITHIVLRVTGLILVVAAASVCWQLIWPGKDFAVFSAGSLPLGNGGILGKSAAVFLDTHLAKLGTWLVVLCCWIVGSILLADTVVFALTRWFGLGVL